MTRDITIIVAIDPNRLKSFGTQNLDRIPAGFYGMYTDPRKGVQELKNDIDSIRSLPLTQEAIDAILAAPRSVC
jgi:hypothetical protein